MDLTTALQETIRLLKRKEAIQKAVDMDLIDAEEEARMREKLAFEYAILRDIYLLPAQEIDIPEPSQTGV